MQAGHHSLPSLPGLSAAKRQQQYPAGSSRHYQAVYRQYRQYRLQATPGSTGRDRQLHEWRAAVLAGTAAELPRLSDA